MKEHFILEAYPDAIIAKLEQRERQKRGNVPSYINGHASALVFEDLKLWRVGALTVSFKGGDALLHRKIAETAKIWTQYGNIEFDFGYDGDTQQFRLWQPSDESHIRVGFEYKGYWSLVGTDSDDPQIVPPGGITLNLENFDNELPNGWEGTVLHEFGHALGFKHEHQSPYLECDFDWRTVYRYFANYHNWPKAKVDHNLRQLQAGGLTYSAHDANSIMHYGFPAWMFLSKENSPCFTSRNHTLSEEDKHMMERAYPYEDNMVSNIDSTRISNLEYLMSLPQISNDMKKQVTKHLKFYKNKR